MDIYQAFKLAGTFFDAEHAKQVEPPHETSYSLYDYSAAFFGEAAEGIRRMSRFDGGLIIEMVVGEGFAMADAIILDTLQRGSGFPTQYDRVHFSNVPDYT